MNTDLCCGERTELNSAGLTSRLISAVSDIIAKCSPATLRYAKVKTLNRYQMGISDRLQLGSGSGITIYHCYSTRLPFEMRTVMV